MKVENRRLTIDPIDPPQEPSRHMVGHQPEVATATGGPVATQQPHRCNRHLQQIFAHAMGKARRVRHAVVVVANWIDAGTVSVAGTLDTVESPRIARSDRKTRRPIAVYALTRNVFQLALGTLYI